MARWASRRNRWIDRRRWIRERCQKNYPTSLRVALSWSIWPERFLACRPESTGGSCRNEKKCTWLNTSPRPAVEKRFRWTLNVDQNGLRGNDYRDASGCWDGARWLSITDQANIFKKLKITPTWLFVKLDLNPYNQRNPANQLLIATTWIVILFSLLFVYDFRTQVLFRSWERQRYQAWHRLFSQGNKPLLKVLNFVYTQLTKRRYFPSGDVFNVRRFLGNNILFFRNIFSLKFTPGLGIFFFPIHKFVALRNEKAPSQPSFQRLSQAIYLIVRKKNRLN